MALTSHRTRSDFPSGAAPDRVYRPKLAGGVANKKYVWYSVGLQRTVFTVGLKFQEAPNVGETSLVAIMEFGDELVMGSRPRC